MTPLVEAIPTTDECRKQSQDPAQRYHLFKPGSAAEEELVEEYLPMVKTVVGRIAMTLPSHVDSDDLHSAGLVGLLNAVRQFNPHGGSTFGAYARVRIRGAIFDELRRLDWVPRSVHDKARRVQGVMQRLEQIKGRLITNAEMAKELDISLDDYEDLMNEIRPITFVCLDAGQWGDEEGSDSRYEDVADDSQEEPGETASRRELARVIAERLEQLPDVQRKVLALYYFEDLRLREIAEVFGVTESRICQIHAQAILAIKSYIRKQESLVS